MKPTRRRTPHTLCTRCGNNLVPVPTSLEIDPVCKDCLDKMINELPPVTPDNTDIPGLPGDEIYEGPTTEYDYYLAMTNAHDLRHPDRPAPHDLPVTDYIDYYTREPIREFNNDEGGCPGYKDSCDNLTDGHHRLCPECTEAEMRAEAKKRECPGYNLGPGEECGGRTLPNSDLCGDCHMARCDIESPRIPL